MFGRKKWGLLLVIFLLSIISISYIYAQSDLIVISPSGAWAASQLAVPGEVNLAFAYSACGEIGWYGVWYHTAPYGSGAYTRFDTWANCVIHFGDSSCSQIYAARGYYCQCRDGVHADCNAQDASCTNPVCTGVGTATINNECDNYDCSAGVSANYMKECRVNGRFNSASWPCAAGNECGTQECYLGSGTSYQCYYTNAGAWTWAAGTEATEGVQADASCWDGFDNDCDGTFDFPNDADCVTADEVGLCADDIDNDMDGLIDYHDPDCGGCPAGSGICLTTGDCVDDCASCPGGSCVACNDAICTNDAVCSSCDGECGCLPGFEWCDSTSQCESAGICADACEDDECIGNGICDDNDVCGCRPKETFCSTDNCCGLSCAAGCVGATGGCDVEEGCDCSDCKGEKDGCADSQVCGADDLCGCSPQTTWCESLKGCVSDPATCPDGCIGGTGGCDSNEGCTCSECGGEEDSCANSQVCSSTTELCGCAAGTSWCQSLGGCVAAGVCTYGCVGADNGVCEDGEGCDCADCISEADGCAGDQICGSDGDCGCTPNTEWCESLGSCIDLDVSSCPDVCNGGTPDTVCEADEPCSCADCIGENPGGGCADGMACGSDGECGCPLNTVWCDSLAECLTDADTCLTNPLLPCLDPLTKVESTPNGICEDGEGCICPDCAGQEDSCVGGAICDSYTQLCKCSAPQIPCNLGGAIVCMLNCPTPLGCIGAADGVCSFGEGCGCSDCEGEQDGCGFGCVCDGDSSGRCGAPSGTCLCDDGTCRPPDQCDCLTCIDPVTGNPTDVGNSSCDPGEGCGCVDCEGEKDSCVTPGACVDGVCLGCDLKNAYWGDSCVGSGKDIQLFVEGSPSCDGQNINFVIDEDDGASFNLGSATFSGTVASVTWSSEWVDDGGLFDDDSDEFTFTASNGGNSITSGELKVDACVEFCDDDCDNFCDYHLRGKIDGECDAAVAAEKVANPNFPYTDKDDYCEFDSGNLVIDANALSEFCEDCDPFGLSPGQESCAAFYDCTAGWWGDDASAPAWPAPWSPNQVRAALEWSECNELTGLIDRRICPSGNLSDPACCAITAGALPDQTQCFCKVPTDPDLVTHNCDTSRFKPVQEKACLSEEQFPFFTPFNALLVVVVLALFYVYRFKADNTVKKKK